MIFPSPIQGLVKPPRNISGDAESGTRCLSASESHGYSTGSLGARDVFEGGFYFIAGAKMNVPCITSKSGFLKCHLLVRKASFFSESHTLHVIHSGTLLIFRQEPLSPPAPCGKKEVVSLDAHMQKSRCVALPAVSSQLWSQNTSAGTRCHPPGR